MNDPVLSGPDEPGETGSIVDKFCLRVTKALTDGSRNNPLVYYRDNKSTRFTIAPLNSKFVSELLLGSVLRTADFEEPPVKLVEPPAAPEPAEPQADTAVANGKPLRGRPTRATTGDALQTRLRKIKTKAKEHEEERGLRSLFAAFGMVSWPAADGGRDPHAPLFLVPITIEDDPRARGQLVVKRLDQSDIVVNRTLLSVAPPACVDAIRGLFADESIDDVVAAYEAVRMALKDIPNLTTTPTSAMGIFNFALMAMIDDLHQSGTVLNAHGIVRALAGDAVAQQALIGNRDGTIDLEMLDSIPPIDEPFVLDADPWQAQSIQTLLKYPTSNAVIEGPPGTGKSQTIANLIAALIAQGKSVLFVCEKRAALDVVKRRLSAVGLDHLVLDMHGADITRKKVYGQLQRAAVQLRGTPAPTATMDGPLELTRERLNEHVRDMHGVIPSAGLSLFQILGALAALPPTLALGIRIPKEKLGSVSADVVDEIERAVRDAARAPGLFLRRAEVPWALSTLAEHEVPAAIDRVAAAAKVLKTLRDALRAIGINAATRSELFASLKPLRDARGTFAICAPAMLGEPPETLALALATLSSPIGPILELFSGNRKAALRAVRSHFVEAGASRSQCADGLAMIRKLEGPWKSFASTIAAWPPELDVAVAELVETLSAATESLGAPLPENLDEAQAWTERCAKDRDGAYRAIRMREIRKELQDSFLGALTDVFEALPPESWASAVRYVWLESHLEPLRPMLARFNGRTHDEVVLSFAKLEAELRSISGQRVCRAAGERYVAVANEYRDEAAMVTVEIGRARPKKPLRELFSEAPHVMLSLAPCVMASPLSVSQLLPRATIFDVVVFDEGSQVAPGTAITSVMRGHRVVVAGDDKQLPPSDFFGKQVEEEDDDEEAVVDAIEGTESFLGALGPFGRHLGLKVHYRSRDERLIAFSNHHLYGDELVTFPGSGGDNQGLTFVHVTGSGLELDELSSGPEVRRVVELIIDHAHARPDESLGVIAFGLTHARRIDAALLEARKARPELDEFFSETCEEPFFVKNLERVQGDERDAIILTVGYGRTKTGRVSHNFGPLNQEGGERRLNVAITRAKSRLTLVSSIRKTDLDPNALRSRGAKLLAAYIGYAESAGRDFGRDGVDESIPPNPFELDIQKALETRLGTRILPQFGVSKFRIDLAVQHPEELGRFVLAVECDGATYHSTPTARMRDRLRQRVLESLGWQFCRIWSTDWFNDREGELDRVEAAYKRAIGSASASSAQKPPAMAVAQAEFSSLPSSAVARREGPCPATPPYGSINDVSDKTFADLVKWIKSDGLLYTDADLSTSIIAELGFARRGARIVARVEAFIRDHPS
jgi:very-short-patch-repair endonuclease